MASDNKKAKADPAPKSEAAAKEHKTVISHFFGTLAAMEPGVDGLCL
jgi:hypothetical protein